LKKTTAIPAHLRRYRARAYTGIALRAAPTHLNQTDLAFSNPDKSGSEIRPATHAAQPQRLRGLRTTFLRYPAALVACGAAFGG